MVVVMLPEEGKGSFAESAKEGLNRESEGVLRISAEWTGRDGQTPGSTDNARE